MRYLLVVLATLFVVLLGAFIFPYTGLYNVAATTGEAGMVRWFLNTTSEHSIKARADEVTIPVDLSDSTLVRRGAVGYSEMCVICHGAPGRDRGVVGQGMTPEPPDLSEEASEWRTEEVYWILAHGIKMAGMPAFGPTHSDEELWEIVAFVEQLPEMTPEQYQTLSTRADTTAGDGHSHAH